VTSDDQRRWDDRYASAEVWQTEHRPFGWLKIHAPAGQGRLALDLACGLGHNTIWLAEQGYRALGVDASRVAVCRAVKAARQHQVTTRVVFAQVDLDEFRPAPGSVDLIAVIRYLNRDLFPALAAALRPGGWLVYATFNQTELKCQPDLNPDYLLYPGELREAFPDLIMVDYEERDGLSCLAARRP